MHYLLAPVSGVLIVAMNALNSRFSLEVGAMASIIVIHAVGFAVVGAALLFRKKRTGSADKLPAHLYAGGLVGVGTVFCCNVAYSQLRPSFAVALALFGQTSFALLVDAVGLFGRKKYPAGIEALPALSLVVLGIGLMAGRDFSAAAYAPFALLAGVLPAASFVLNSRLSERIGILRGTFMNYATGLGAACFAAGALSLFRPYPGSVAQLMESVRLAGPVSVFGGGLLGVSMVAASNFVFSRIPALSATLLMFAGQSGAGLVLDAVRGGAFDLRSAAGTALVLSGLAANAARLGRR